MASPLDRQVDADREHARTSHADFQPYSVTAPVDPRLGDASGRLVDDLWNISPSKFGLISNDTISRTTSPGANRRTGGTASTSTSTRVSRRPDAARRRRRLDRAATTGAPTSRTATTAPASRRPEHAELPHRVAGGRPEYKALGSYTIPKIDVQVAGTLTSRPGPPKVANVQFRAAEIAQTLGRFPSGAASADIDDDHQPLRDQRSVLPADQRRRSARRQDPARSAACAPTSALDVYNAAQREHGADLQRHLLSVDERRSCGARRR